VLMQNDDFGKDYWNGFKEGLGKDAVRVTKHVTYETTDPTVDSQVIQLKDSGANVFFVIAIPKFAAQAMRKAGDIGWKPAIYLNNVSSSVASAMKPAGFENVQGVITALYLMDPTDKQFDGHPDMKAWVAWMGKHNAGASLEDASNVFAYSVSALMHETLKKCGDDLTRENVMKQATHLDMELPLLLPGIRLKTSPTDLRPIKQMRLVRFDGARYVLFSDVIASE
jgi:branched-chain amino acid transport system substrate-binding protein